MKKTFKTQLGTLYNGDVVEVLKQLPADSVDCVVTSPPYWGLRDYGCDGQIGLEKDLFHYMSIMTNVFEHVKRVLRPSGTLWLNMGDSYIGHWRGGNQPGFNANSSKGLNSGNIPTGLKKKDMAGQHWRLAFALQDAGWWLRQDIVWSKTTPMPESVKDRCTKSHEYVFLLAKSGMDTCWKNIITGEWAFQKPNLREWVKTEVEDEFGRIRISRKRKWQGRDYYYNNDAIKEPCSANTHSRGKGDYHKLSKAAADASSAFNRKRNTEVGGRQKTPDGWDTRKGAHNKKIGSYGKQNESYNAAVKYRVTHRNKRSVWTIPSQPCPEAHFATFPEALVQPCLLAGCPEGGTIMDPFMGSGTVGLVAEKYDRKWIGIELNPEYCNIAKKRIMQYAEQGKLFA